MLKTIKIQGERKLTMQMSLCAFAEEAEQKTYVSGYFEYRLLENGTAEIVKYKGNAEKTLNTMSSLTVLKNRPTRRTSADRYAAENRGDAGKTGSRDHLREVR